MCMLYGPMVIIRFEDTGRGRDSSGQIGWERKERKERRVVKRRL